MVILIYESQTQICNVEDILLEAEIEVEIISTPKEINHDCGNSIAIGEGFQDIVLNILKKYNLTPNEMYIKREGSYIKL